MSGLCPTQEHAYQGVGIAQLLSHLQKTLDTAGKTGIGWPLVGAVNNEMRMERLLPEEHQKTVLYVRPDYIYIHADLVRKGVNLTLIW